MSSSLATPPRVQDDRAKLDGTAPVLLIIEDDDRFARPLLELARARGFRGVVALSGADGLELSRRIKPDAISLDLALPDMDGWVVLDQLKHDPETRNIPVQVVTASDEERRGLEQGALAFVTKPADEATLSQSLDNVRAFLTRSCKELLLVGGEDSETETLLQLLGNGDLHTVIATSAAEALATLEAQQVDCIAAAHLSTGTSCFDLLHGLKERPGLCKLPIIVRATHELTDTEEAEIRRAAHGLIVNIVRTREQLIDRISLFLHRKPRPGSAGEAGAVGPLDLGLAGKKALIVDDDLRNVFATTALLEQYQMVVSFAENGQEALAKLDAESDIDVVFMDIMMPEMDGYEATRRIRQQARFAKLPVIALTAKAMKGDREKCISAGASDYITKPIDSDQLLSLLRVWLYR